MLSSLAPSSLDVPYFLAMAPSSTSDMPVSEYITRNRGVRGSIIRRHMVPAILAADIMFGKFLLANIFSAICFQKLSGVFLSE